MAYEHEEIISLILKTDQMNAGLKDIETRFNAAKALLGEEIKVRIKADDYIIDLKKLELARIKSEENIAKLALRIAADKEKAALKAQQDEEKYAAKAALRAAKDAAAMEAAFAKGIAAQDKEIERQRVNNEKLAAASAARQAKAETAERIRAAKDYAAMQAAADKADIARVKEEAARQHQIDVELHRFRVEGDKEAHARRMQQIREEATLSKQASQFNNIFAPGGKPLGITPGAAPTPGGFNASATLRAGAGAAGAIGAYPAAGALYASANAMQALGISTITATQAAVLFAPAIAAVGAAFVAYKFVEWGAEFSRELARMSTLMLSTKASAEEFATALDRTATSALKISSAFNMEAIDVLKAFKEALSSGIDVSDLERFTTTAAKLSVATQTSIMDTVNLLTSIKDAYGFSVGEMAHQSDLLFNSINVGKVQLKDYVTGFARLADAGNAAGVRIEELHNAIDGMTRVGMPANRTMTSMVATIHALENPSKQMIENMGALGLSLEDINLRARGLDAVMASISKATKGGVGADIGKLFEDERARQGIKSYIRAANIITNEVIPANKELDTSAVAAGRAMNNLSDDIGKMLTKMSNDITASSHATGSWFDRLWYGSGEEKATKLKQVEDDVKAMVRVTKDALSRGNTEEGALRTAMAVTRPHLLKRSDEQLDSNLDNARESMAQLRVAMQYALGEIRDDAVKVAREIDEALQKAIIDAALLLDKVSKPIALTKMSKVEAKELNSRATDEQKQKLLDLAEEMEDEKELLETKKKQLAVDMEAKQIAFANANINPIEDKINAAMREGGDKGSLPGLTAKLEDTKKEFAKFSETVKDELTNTAAFDPFLAKIFDLTLTIETMRARISGQDTNKMTADKKKAADKADADAVKAKEEFNSIVERLYNDDLKAYEKAQKARVALFKEADKEVTKQAKKSAETLATINNNILKSKMDAKKDDPGAQGRIAREARDTALAEVKNAAGGSDENKFNSAMSKYQTASEGARDAMSRIDNERAQRAYQEDQAALVGPQGTFDENFKWAAQQKAMSTSSRDNSVAVRSPQQLAKDASKVMQTTTEITKVVLDAQVKLQVDGTLSEQTKAELVKLVTDKVKQMNSNRNPSPSAYDPSNRESRSVVSPNDE